MKIIFLKIIFLFTIFFLASVLSCTIISPQTFVVSRNVPESPTFVVIPVGITTDQTEFGNKIEQALIGMGIKVVLSPVAKEVEIKKGIGGTASESDIKTDHQIQAESIRLERYYEYADFEANYIIYSNSNSRRISIIKYGTREILTTFSVSQNEQENISKDMFSALKLMGIKVRE